MFCCNTRHKKNEKVEGKRTVVANSSDLNNMYGYAKNRIRTSKYTMLTFLPKNLGEQLLILANLYFIILLCLQLVPQISSLSYVSTVVPLSFVFMMKAIKDVMDDIQRHNSDRQINDRKATVIHNGKLSQICWHQIEVGDVIRIESDNPIAADVLILSTSENDGLTFVETAELDGETNLKVRYAIRELNEELKDRKECLLKFNGRVECELPNNNLNKFEGVIYWKDKSYPLTLDNVLLRGCVQRNAAWSYGLVVLAGKDTKLMKNSGAVKFKRTKIDRQLNMYIIGIMGFLFTLCLILAIISGVFEYDTGYFFQAYMPWENDVRTRKKGSLLNALLNFFSYVILLNTLIPISLYVCVEIFRSFQSSFINTDAQMKAVIDGKMVAAKARSTTLNEELGQIEYIFSDKTGTLTRNIMVFHQCSICGELFQSDTPISDEKNPFTSNFMNETLNKPTSMQLTLSKKWPLSQMKGEATPTSIFFKLLAICHTVMATTDEKNEIVYQAQSPDEAALVNSAKNFGYEFRERTPNSITFKENGIERTMNLLHILEFDNVRKRMSVIVEEENGEIFLYIKGADTTIQARLQGKQRDLIERTNDHLNQFATEGLRTLCLAYKHIDRKEFDEWNERYMEASKVLNDREKKMDHLREEIETDLILLGATAVEDRLQDDVPQTISNLAKAGIKLWVLTGDKQETAINIGYSCQLLNDEMSGIFLINKTNREDVRDYIRKALTQIDRTLEQYGNNREKFIKNSQQQFPKYVNSAYSNGFGDNVPFTEQITGSTTSISCIESAEFGIEDYEDIQEPLGAAPSKNLGGFALVINGSSLSKILQDDTNDGLFKRRKNKWKCCGKKTKEGDENINQIEQLFLELACLCSVVICCRVTPLQKARVVKLVKQYKGAITLAIGDGANDVSMIKKAHIGVGISGKEGMQAVLASDFSISQFRFLERLLLVHGRWSYRRLSKFLGYFFYKNFTMTLCNFCYAFYCGYTATNFYDSVFITVYNVIYTSLPVLAMGILDKDVSDEISVQNPSLYLSGVRHELFNLRKIMLWMLEGVISAAVTFFIVFCTKIDLNGDKDGKDISDLDTFSFTMSTAILFLVTARCAIETQYLTWINIVTLIGSVLIYFPLQILVYHFYFNDQRYRCLGTIVFWLTILLVMAVLLMPVITWKFIQIDKFPSLSDRLRKEKRSKKIEKPLEIQRHVYHNHSTRQKSGTVPFSGYCFSQEEGMGKVIRQVSARRNTSRTRY
ncbi:hypothetical protein SNEBB_006271 [Seison nebaliae]|nr:hypothetical protein SNEBB_006271 [Seison nebaliae]